MSLLTTDQLVFSADSRFSVVHDESVYNWRLVIQSAQERDAASYLCQVNTHPPATLLVQLIVIGEGSKTSFIIHKNVLEVPGLSSVDDQGQPVMEKYFKPGSTIVLRCFVINYRPDFQAPVWRRENSLVTVRNSITNARE